MQTIKGMWMPTILSMVADEVISKKDLGLEGFDHWENTNNDENVDPLYEARSPSIFHL